MATDWIKMRKNLPTDPRVVRISSALKADRLRTVGALFCAWCLFDEHSEDGTLVGYTPQSLDAIVGIEGLTEAMESVGWIEQTPQGLVATRFADHMGQSAKRRAQDVVRKMSARKADKCPLQKRTKSGPEKEIEKEKSIPPKAPQGAKAHDPEFEAWWKSYPVRDERTPRGNKAKARAEWDRLKPEDRPRVAEATRNLVLSGQLPKDAERFLRAPPGGGDPVWRTWLERDSGAPRASQGKPNAVARKEAQNHAEDYSWLTEQHPTK